MSDPKTIKNTRRKPLSTAQKFAVAALIIVAIGAAFVAPALFNKDRDKTRSGSIASFTDCQKAGHTVSPDYPRQCISPDRRVFTEKLITVQEPYADDIKLRGTIVEFIGYAPAETGGDVPIPIESEDKTRFTVFVSSDESTCDVAFARLMKDRHFKVGDTIEVNARLSGLAPIDGQGVDDVGFYRVCDEGTYIKKIASVVNQPAEPAVIHYFEGFEPSAITVKAGVDILIKNGAALQLASVSNSELNLKKIEPNEAIIFRVTKKGTFEFYNRLDPSHRGSITVE